MRPDRWRWWRVPVWWLVGGRFAGCGQRRRPSGPLPDGHRDFVVFDGYILAEGMHEAARLDLRDDLEILSQRYSAMIKVRYGWAYIRCQGPIEAFLAARDEMLVVLELYNLLPELVPMGWHLAALRSLQDDEHRHFRRARREWVRSQIMLSDWHTRTLESIDSWTWKPDGD